MYSNDKPKFARSLVSAYGTISMIVHAMACQPAKNAGALTAVNAISDAVPLIHGPLGCGGLRKMNSFGVYSLFPDTPCTNLNELDLVYGAEKKLIRGIVETYKRYRPALIVIIPTCPSDMIGDDMAAAVSAAKREVDCEVVYSTGELIKGRPAGYHDVLCSLFDQLLPEGTKVVREEDSVNIITFPIHTAGRKVREMKEILEQMGIKVNKVFFHNTRLKDIYDLPRAALNITDLPMPWLDRMKARFGTDYFVTTSIGNISEATEIMPLGIRESGSIFLNIARVMGKERLAKDLLEKKMKEAEERLQDEIKPLKNRKFAVVGGFLMSLLGLLLVKDMGMKADVLIYKTHGLESHGMGKAALKRMVETDRETAERYGLDPEILVNPSHKEEIRAIKESEADIVIAPTADMFRYHQAGIRAFDSINFFSNVSSIGFECPLRLAGILKEELERPAERHPLLGMLDYDQNEPTLLPHWVRLENVWRTVIEGADGGVYMDEMIFDSYPDSKLLGAMRALNGIRDAVSIVHGRSCCHADSLLFNVLTSPNDDIRLLGSGMRAQDISVGGHRKLSLAIRSAYEEFHPELIAILVASVPTLMGDDVDGTIVEMEKEIPCKICNFPCAGYQGHMNEGYEEVLCGLVKYMTPSTPVSDMVNIIGFKPDEPHGAANLKEVKRMLADHAVKVNSVLTASGLEEIKNGPRASLNVVLGGDGLGCARLMEEQFGTPYVVAPYPFGWEQSVDLVMKVAGALGKKADQDVISGERDFLKKKLQQIYTYLQGIYGLPAAVVGEAGRAFHLARFLTDEIGLKIKLLSITSKNPHLEEMKGENRYFEDLFITPDHFRMGEAVRAKDVEILFGSTAEKKLADELNIPLIRTSYPILDQVAVSDIPYAGFKGIIHLTEQLINAVIGRS